MVNLRANVTDDENERRTAQWERAKYVRELSVSSTGARRRGQQFSADLVQVREKSASMNGSVMRQQDSARWLRHHVFRGGIILDLVTTRVPERGDTVSGCDTCDLRTAPKNWGTVRSGQGSHNTGGTGCLLPGNRTGISLTLLRDVSSDGVRPVLPETPA